MKLRWREGCSRRKFEFRYPKHLRMERGRLIKLSSRETSAVTVPYTTPWLRRE
jgi:hypothetical protein